MTLESQNKEVSQSGKEVDVEMDLSIAGETDLDRRILNFDYEYYITPSFKVQTGVKDRFLIQNQPRSIWLGAGSGQNDYVTEFTYNERIRAAYLNMEYTTFMEDIVFIGGIRMEDAETKSDANLDSVLYHLSGFYAALIPDRTNHLTRYSKWYPSFLVRYRPNLYTTYQAGYSARVNRPTTDFVDPLPQNLFEPSVIQIGNPNLEPEFINAYELKFSQIKSVWSWEVALFGQQIKNVVREDEDLLDSTSVITWKNAGSGTNVGVDGRIKFKPLSFWDFTLTGLYYNTRTDHANENDLSGTLTGFQGRVTQVFTSRNGGKLELDSRLFSPEKIPTGTVHPDGLSNMNLTFRNNLLDDRVELSFKILDAFNNEERKSETSEIELVDQIEYVRNLNSFSKPDRRTFYMNIRYKFGTADKKSITKKVRQSKGYRY
jgi:outer membrane receptor protein involved in Fe transport